jgi:uncharacterized protein (DUF2267 family)
MPSGRIKSKTRHRPAEIKADWITALDRRLGWNDLPRSYRLLNAVLHAVDATLAERPTSHCDTNWQDTDSGRPDVSLFLRRVATGFRPDRLEDSKSAVLVVIDVLDGLIDEPGLGWLRDAFIDTAFVDLSAIKWGRAGDLFTKEYLG